MMNAPYFWLPKPWFNFRNEIHFDQTNMSNRCNSKKNRCSHRIQESSFQKIHAIKPLVWSFRSKLNRVRFVCYFWIAIFFQIVNMELNTCSWFEGIHFLVDQCSLVSSPTNTVIQFSYVFAKNIDDSFPHIISFFIHWFKHFILYI